jgi:hypothetical protein
MVDFVLTKLTTTNTYKLKKIAIEQGENSQTTDDFLTILNCN